MPRPIGTKNGQGLGARVGLNLRISKADRAGFDAASAKAGVKTSEWARTILRREAGLWTGAKETSMSKKSGLDLTLPKHLNAKPPKGATWWECPDCGDYAWLWPGEDAPECTCGGE